MSVFFILLALHCFAFEMPEAAAHRSNVRDSGRVFLTNLYHKLVDKNGEKTLDASEVIHAVQGKVDSKSSVIHFIIKAIKTNELIQKAEIHVKVACCLGNRAIPNLPIWLGLYDVVEVKLISRAVLRKSLRTWVVFTVHSDVITQWLHSQVTNRGVKVEVMTNTERQRNFCPQVLVYGGNNSSQEEPFMVVHTNGAPLHDVKSTPALKSRVRRNVPRKKHTTTESPSLAQNHLCSRRRLYIRYKYFPFDPDAVIAPDGIVAYECAGICNYTASPDIFSRHAIMRWNVINKNQEVKSVTDYVTAPCCVPTNFTAISLLMFSDESHKAFIQKIEGMVVTECGCR